MVDLNDAVVQCLDDSRVDAFVVSPIEIAPGLLMPQFGARPAAGGSEEEALSLISVCFFEYIGYAQQFYENQPNSADQQIAAFEEARPDVLACLKEHGVELDDRASNDEVYQAVNQDIADNGQLPDFEPCYQGGYPSGS